MARLIQGVVVSRPGNKSIVIAVKQAKLHPLYKKRYTRTSKYMAHDEDNAASLGDMVEITEIRPMSASKRFSLNKVVTKAATTYKPEDATADIEKETIGEKEVAANNPPDGEKK